MFKPGDSLRDYRILARLRAGGMATLYLAQRRGAAGFARPVAIKVIHPHLADNASFVRMFIDEGMLCAKIADPHVVHVEELGEHDGTYFLAMEYVHGCSLAQVMRALAKRKRRMATEVAVHLCAQAAAGLHAAHEARGDRGEPLGVVHRDVSPHNVLVAYAGHVKVIDFGIAKAQGSARLTATGSLRGKIAYMPPEQAFGRPIDRRADVYALAIMLWEMLTMQRMFDAENELALLEKVRAPDIPRPTAFVPELPQALDDAVMKALARDAADRPATAQEFRRLILDAVPAALKLESSEISALLHALVPETDVAVGKLALQVADTQLAAPAAEDGERVLSQLTAVVANATFEIDLRDVELVGPEAPTVDVRPRRSRRTVAVGIGVALAAAAVTMGIARFGRSPASAADASTVAPPPSAEPPATSGAAATAAPTSVEVPTAVSSAAPAASATAAPAVHSKLASPRTTGAPPKPADSAKAQAPPILGNPYGKP